MKKIILLVAVASLFSQTSFANDACLLKVLKAVTALESSDLDHSGTISKQESISAYEKNSFFAQDLNQILIGQNSNEVLKKGVFTYFLRYSDKALSLPMNIEEFTKLTEWLTIMDLPTTQYEVSYLQVIQSMLNLYSCPLTPNKP